MCVNRRRKALAPPPAKTSGGFFHSIASRVLCAKTGVHAGRPFSFTYYITAESESSYSAVSIVHLVYSMCQIFSSSSPVLFLVPGACAAGTQTAPCRTNKNASSPSTYASFARSRDTKSADAYSDKHAWQSSSCARQTHARGNPAFSPCAFLPSGSYFSVIFAILAAGKRCA